MARDELCMRITERIVKQTGTTETLDPPLYDVVDTDALEQLIQSTASSSGVADCVVSFTYHDCTVTVDSAGRVDVVAGSPVPFHLGNRSTK